MKKTIKYFLGAFLATVLFSACHSELLEPTPRTTIFEEVAFDTKDRILGQVNGIYAAVKHGNYLGGRYLVYNSIRSDEFNNLQTNGVTGFLTWNHTLANSTGEVQSLWGQVYTSINRANMFLEGMELNKQNILSKNILTEAEFNQFKGEALAVRGMAFFHLIQLYAQPYNKNPQAHGAILRLTGTKTPADNDKARSTLADTYTQILADLNAAENLLPAITAGTTNATIHVTRMQKYTVAALKSRVYLHMNNYAKVQEEANKIVSASAPFTSPDGVAYALSSSFESIFRTPYTTSESILSMPMSASEIPGTQNGVAYYFSRSPIGNNEYCINTESVTWSSNVFTANDARRLLTNTATVGGQSRIFINKYSVTNSDWVPVIRYAEVLLNLAEAEARLAWPNQRAVALLNAVYLRSNPTADPLADFASADAFVDRIMLERNIEFLGEGIRNMDTMRKMEPHLAKPGVNAVPHTAPNYVWPIPQTEMNTNQLVQPN